MTRRRLTSPGIAFAVVELECLGGPRDGERLTLRNLRPVQVEGELAGYIPDEGPEPTEAGAYVVTPGLKLEWEAREDEPE